jgi:hypothetical protein
MVPDGQLEIVTSLKEVLAKWRKIARHEATEARKTFLVSDSEAIAKDKGMEYMGNKLNS